MPVRHGRKVRAYITIDPALFDRWAAAAEARGIPLGAVAEEALRREIDIYRCPVCGAECEAGRGGCAHFDPARGVWALPGSNG